MSELASIIYVICAFVAMYLAKLALDLQMGRKFDADKEIDKGNLAVGFRRTGIYLAIALGLFGALIGPGRGLAMDLAWLGVDTILLIIFVFIAKILTDKVTLPHIDNNRAVKEGNLAVGVAEAGILVATGLVAMGSFMGFSPTFASGVVSSIIFFVLGQGALILSIYLYEVFTPFKLLPQIKDNNVAAGAAVGGTTFAVGIIICYAIAGPSHGWIADINSFLWAFVKGVVLLALIELLIDRLFLPHANLTQIIEKDRNVAAVTMLVGIKVAIAFILVGSVI